MSMRSSACCCPSPREEEEEPEEEEARDSPGEAGTRPLPGAGVDRIPGEARDRPGLGKVGTRPQPGAFVERRPGEEEEGRDRPGLGVERRPGEAGTRPQPGACVDRRPGEVEEARDRLGETGTRPQPGGGVEWRPGEEGETRDRLLEAGTRPQPGAVVDRRPGEEEEAWDRLRETGTFSQPGPGVERRPGEEARDIPGLGEAGTRPQPGAGVDRRPGGYPSAGGRLGSEAGALQAAAGGGGAAGAQVTGAGAATTAATGRAPASGSSSPPRWRKVGRGRGGGGAGACLQQLVLLQLDLIEQQQQRIQEREREIGELRADKGTLLARIERMERRMQLVRKDSDKDQQRRSQSRETADMPEGPLPEGAGGGDFPLQTSPRLSGLTPKPFSYGRKGHKRKSAFGSSERKTPIKRLASDFGRLKSKASRAAAAAGGDEEPEPGGSLSEAACCRELRSKETPEKGRAAWGHAAHRRDREADGLPYLSTTDMYLSCWHPPLPSPLREPSPRKEESVAIPSWREHQMEPLTDLDASDIPENLDDAVFAKRHAKLELDEKRRKRWDIQRIREQRILQRLQLRMYKKKGGSQECEPGVTSFFPELDEVESVMITPHLPVVAFGRPLPKIPAQNFALPWLDERSRCRLEMQKKQTPHRTCRK